MGAATATTLALATTITTAGVCTTVVAATTTTVAVGTTAATATTLALGGLVHVTWRSVSRVQLTTTARSNPMLLVNQQRRKNVVCDAVDSRRQTTLALATTLTT